MIVVALRDRSHALIEVDRDIEGADLLKEPIDEFARGA
jgi:hypothetical protein